MARVQTALCDVCGTPNDVHVIMVSWGGKRSHPWEADLCEDCYEKRVGDLFAKSRRAGKSNVRPQHRMEKLDDTKFSV